ncbi:MAG: 1-acyl-sn-glycerol-3-phosphate acyltransferase [Clostridia bacterium]|nr:1-acyl-sn-glycerol-3-phosphate acyltransferase [Clostridia bacterium]
MIIGANREEVIKNIAKASNSGEFIRKVETNDPVITKEQGEEIINKYLTCRKTSSYKLKSFAARKLADFMTCVVNKDTEIIGIDKVKDLKGGAIITSNHFSPLDNTMVRLIAKKLGKKRINIVSQQRNFAMDGIIGFLMNYADTIPLGEDHHYIYRDLTSIIKELTDNDEFVLIYPEQEMWFNYRKPRPAMRGAFYYAAKLNLPVISCFVEMQDEEELDTESFHKVRYKIHILDVLTPDSKKSVRESSRELCKTDYMLKKNIYETVYQKPLDYTFQSTDIAGWIGELHQ